LADGLRAALTIAAKDIAIELRAKAALASGLVFAILVLAILYFARDPTVVPAIDIAPGALWVTLTFAAMLGLNRAFHIERERRAIDGVLLAATPRPALFAGKMLANLAYVGMVEAVSIPLFALFYGVPIWHVLPPLVGIIVVGTLGFVAVGTLLSAMVVRTRFAEMVLPLLLLPFLVPPLVGGVQLTTRVLAGRPLSEWWGWLKLLAAYDLVFLTLAFLLFDHAIDE
jgi:heme exporter protein B